MAKKPVSTAAKKSPSHQGTTGVSNDQNWFRLGWIALAITAACYLPTLRFDFVNWDDPANILENPNLQLVGKGQAWSTTLGNIFDLEKGSVIGNYNPLSILSFALEKQLNGGEFSATLTHFGNLLLHLATVFFVMKLLWGMGLGRWGVFVGGLLFGIHPMRVESVAWATERKDVLFALFFFLALVYYLKWLKQAETDEKRSRTYGIMLGLALLSCLSKVQAVTLPLSMLALDFWFRRLEIDWKFVLNAVLTALTGGLIFLVLPRTPDREPFREKIPFWLLSLLFGALNIYTLSLQGATDDSVTNLNFLDRLCMGAYAYCTYLYKLVLPYPMSPLYSYPKVIPWTVYSAPLVFAGVAAGFIWALLKGKRAWVFGMFFFTVNVMFLLQIFAAGQGLMADRFTYVAYFGLFVILADYLNQRSQKEGSASSVYGIIGLIALIFGAWTIRQSSIWKNGSTLWTHVMGQSEGESEHSLLPYYNRAQMLTQQGDFEGALKDYNRALEIDPNNPDLIIMRGKTYFFMASSERYKSQQKTLLDKAMQEYSLAISKPNITPKAKSDAFISRGTAQGMANVFDASIRDLTEGLQLDPANKNGYANRAMAYMTIGQYEKALADYQEYLKIDPENANFWYESGMIQRSLQRYDDALKSLNNSIQRNPKLGLAYLERARAKSGLGMADAMQDFRQAQKLGVNLNPAEQQMIGAQGQ